jgi:hypothetical protein
MNDGPTRILLKTMNSALKEWFHAARSLHPGRRTIRRGATTAAAVTLAAGMAAAPAAAAPPDPSTDEPRSSSAQHETQLAQMIEVEPEPSRGFEVDPFLPNRDLENQFRNDAELQRTFRDFKNYKAWNDRMQELETARRQQELEPGPFKEPLPAEQFFESVPPGPRNEGPSLLPNEQRRDISRELAKQGLTEPLGYLNPYESWRALGPAKDAEARLAADRQWLRDQLQESLLPEDQRKGFEDALNDFLSRIHQAQDPDQRDVLIDGYNALKDDFNRAELDHRDANNLYGEDGRQVPRALDPGLPEPAPESLRESKAALQAQEQQEALDVARQHALEPGVMTGADVNIGTPDTNPGPVGGTGQEDPAKATTGAVNEGRITDTEPDQANDPPADTNDDSSTDNSQTSPDSQNTIDGTGDNNGSPEGRGESSVAGPGENGTDTGTNSVPGTTSESETSPGDDSSADTNSSTDTSSSAPSSESESTSDPGSGGTGSTSESTNGGGDSAGSNGGGDSADSGSGSATSSDSSGDAGGGSTGYGGSSESSGDSGSSSSGGDSASSGGDGGSSGGGGGGE